MRLSSTFFSFASRNIRVMSKFLAFEKASNREPTLSAEPVSS